MKQILQENFQTILPDLAGSALPWLRDMRMRAFEKFCEKGFPTRKEENWKYTDLSFLKNQALLPTIASDLKTLPECFQKNQKDVHRLVFIDASFVASLSDFKKLSDLCSIVSIKDALTHDQALIKAHLQALKENNEVRLLDLNNALMSDGYIITVEKNTIIEKPVHILYVSSSIKNSMSCTRNILKLGENASVSVFEEHINLNGTSTLDNHITQISLSSGSKLHHYKLQTQSSKAIHVAQTVVEQNKDSTYNSYNVTMGGKLSRDDLHIKLSGEGAGCSLNGVYVGEDMQHIDHHTRIEHCISNCTSHEYYKGILSGKAKGVFNGKVIVQPDAQKTRSQQTNKNLLLSNTAEANAKPELEIYADDVTCAHGATIGQIDEASLFYLRSRGMNKSEAIALLVRSFADEILEAFPDQNIANYMMDVLHKKMADMLSKEEN